MTHCFHGACIAIFDSCCYEFKNVIKIYKRTEVKRNLLERHYFGDCSLKLLCLVEVIAPRKVFVFLQSRMRFYHNLMLETRISRLSCLINTEKYKTALSEYLCVQTNVLDLVLLQCF